MLAECPSDHRPSASLPSVGRSYRTGRLAAPTAVVQMFLPILLGLSLVLTAARAVTQLGPPLAAARLGLVGAPNLLDLSEQPASTTNVLSPVFTPEVQHWAPSIRHWADEYGLPADLIAVVIQIESCGDPHALSPAGASGLFQVMPFHFRPGEDPFDADTNATRGLEYLADGLRLASGEPALALAGYNGGHGVIGLPPSDWADETQRYVTWGEGILDEARAGLRSSPRLEAWLAAGGDRLCREARRHQASTQASS